MSVIYKDRVKESSVSIGTGNFTLQGAYSGFQTFNAAFGVGQEFYYVIESAKGGKWEVGLGELSSATTLVRTTVLASSNSGNAAVFSAGTKTVFASIPAAAISLKADITDPRIISTINDLDVAGTGTISPAATEFEYEIIRATGILTGDRTVNWPGTSTDRRQILFWNDTSGNFDLYVKATADAGAGIRTTQGAQSILINDGTEVVDVTAAVTRVPFYVLEFDGSPQTVDLGRYYPFDTDLGACFYECWVRLGTGANSACYDWSEGYGGAHAMLRNPYGGNTYRGFIVMNATNTTPIIITTSHPHGLTTGSGQILNIHGVLGNTAANVSTPTITVLSSTTFSIDTSVGNGEYLGGGVGYGVGGFGGWGLVSFAADDVPYVGQWAHSATHFGDTGGGGQGIIQYYDGIPVGFTLMTGTRLCPSVGGNGDGFLGGSDHNNFVGRIAQYRIFEGGSPRESTEGGRESFLPFAPHTIFGSAQTGIVSGNYNASTLFSFYQPAQMVTDQGVGFPVGYTHSARLYGANYGIANRSSYPAPQYVIDAEAPNTLALVAPVQPDGKVYSPLTPPAGAIVYDSIERANSTYAFDGRGGLGSTESGSAGVLAWQYSVAVGPSQVYHWGILNEQYICLAPPSGSKAYVEAGATNLDIRVTKVGPSTNGSGGSATIMFRYTDASNYWYLGVTPTSWELNKVVAGVLTNVDFDTGLTLNTGVLRVVTKADGTYAAYFDATSLTSGSSADLASATKAGIKTFDSGGVPNDAALTHRWKYFTILPAV
jgi:hypothetical protein